jgi:hypothetical protein
VWHERDRKPDRVSKRKRMAQRADKWWRSVWHVQMCMSPHGCNDVDLGSAKPLTVDVGRAFLKAKSTSVRSTKPNVGRSDNTEGDTR